jgi:DNA-directed RNA polymerase subunit RPC12/RpoP
MPERRRTEVFFKCAVCGSNYEKDEAKEKEFVCPKCGTLLKRIGGRERREIEPVFEFYKSVPSQSSIGFGEWKMYKVETSQGERMVCSCPGYLKYGWCRHVKEEIQRLRSQG